MTATKVHPHAEAIGRLRDLADWLSEHPETQDASIAASQGKFELIEYCRSLDKLARRAELLGGDWEEIQRTGSPYLRLQQQVLPGVTYVLYTDRPVAGEVERVAWRCPAGTLAGVAA